LRAARTQRCAGEPELEKHMNTQQCSWMRITMIPLFLIGWLFVPGAWCAITGFGGDGTGWTLNAGPFGGAPPVVQNDVLHLTSSQLALNSVFFNQRQDIRAFTASFTYQNLTPYDGWNPGDGMVFVLQNQGLIAVGSGGGSSLGYLGITPATGIAINLFEVVGTGYAPTSVPWGYRPVTPVDLHSLHPIDVTITFDGFTLFESLYDQVAHVSFTTTYAVDLLGDAGGDLAFIGFTGGCGSAMADQNISNFSFTTIPEPAPFSPLLLGFCLLWVRRRYLR